MKIFSQFPKGVCDPERLRTARQEQSSQVSARPRTEGSPMGRRGWWERPNQADRGGTVKRKSGGLLISKRSQEYLKAKRPGPLNALVAKTSLIYSVFLRHPLELRWMKGVGREWSGARASPGWESPESKGPGVWCGDQGPGRRPGTERESRGPLGSIPRGVSGAWGQEERVRGWREENPGRRPWEEGEAWQPG